MAMVPSQLVASKVLLQFLIDKDTGLPLASGTINLYKDNNRLIRKNWYFKQGTPSAGYTYAALPNPMTLSGSGVIVDSMGNEVTPYYYPFDEDNSATQELYYITVYNSAATFQFDQQGWPPLNRAESVGEQATLQNLIVNNQFWNQNVSSQAVVGTSPEVTLTLTNETNIAICPSNHDGYSMPDIRFMKDVTGANDTIVFKRYANTDPLFTGNVTPQFYIHISCSSLAAETYKFIQFPICLNTRNLEQEPFIFTIQTKLPSGAASRNISARILKYLGSANLVALGDTIGTGTITPTSSWAKSTLTGTFPTLDAADLISPTADDAFYLQLSLPTNQAYEFDIAVPSLYLGSIAATNDFQSYDKIDSITNSPRTGDYRHTLNRFQLGWVPANDGTIGQRGSGATTRANTDCWPLYKLIYENVSRTWAPLSATVGSAYADFIAGNKLSLTKNLGRVLQGLDPIFVTPSTFTASVSTLSVISASTVTDQIELGSAFTFFNGQPLQFNATGTLPGVFVPGDNPSSTTTANTFARLQANTTYYAIFVDTTHIKLAFTLAEALAGTAMNIVDAGTQPNTIINTNNVLTLATSQSPVLKAGTAVILTNSGGALPGGLSASTIYYIVNRSLAATTITLSDNLKDALDGYYIPILTAGTGTHTVNNALGAYNGSGYTTDVARHSHIQNADTWYDTAAGNAAGVTVHVNLDGSLETFVEGVERVSLIQPSAYVNLYLKL